MAVRSANVNVRVEPEIKVQAEAILEQLGISASSFINMTYRQLILHIGIPYDVKLKPELITEDSLTDAQFNQMLEESIRQSESGENIDMDEAFDNLLKDL